MGEDEAEDSAEPLIHMAEALFARPESLAELVVFKHYDEGGTLVEDPDTTWNDQTIISSRAVAKVEVGHMKKGSRLHLHVALKIWHRSWISLKRQEMMDAMNEYLTSNGYPYPIVYLHITVRGPSAEDYLEMGTMED